MTTRQINITMLSLFALAGAESAAYAYDVEFAGATRTPVEVAPERNTGLDAIFVAYDTAEISEISISGFSGTEIEVSKYSNLGGGYAVEIPSEYTAGTVIIPTPEGDMGYIVRNGDRSYSFWLVNYLPKTFRAEALEASAEQDCNSTRLDFHGNASPIHYFTIDGRQRTLSRQLHLSYTTLEWDEENSLYQSVEQNRELESAEGYIEVMPAFYCNTAVTLTGDRFLQEWGIAAEVESPMVHANGVSVNTKAEQNNLSDDEEASNQIKTDGGTGLGGSAPADITFYGYVTDAVLHTEWQIASDPNFDYILSRFNEQDLQYTFEEEGQYYLRFIGSNADGSCEAYSDTYTVSIGASDLRIPNAFSPDGDGVNDEWKVGYRSLLEFRCWIFDRNGTQMCYFDSPDKGWDGKYKGKTVAPGVYYYVIEAKGADGRKYKKGGDINIIRYKKIGNSTSGATGE